MKSLLKRLSISILVFSSSCTNENQVLEAENTINSKDFEKHVIALASDEFQGRKPFTIGEEKATQYIANEFKKIGIEGAFEGSYYQNVPLVELNFNPDKNITIETPKGDLTLYNTKDLIAKTPHIKDSIEIKNTEIIFAGYGIVAP